MATFILKKDVSQQFYWIIKSDKNYKIIARSSESYDDRNGAKDSIDWIRNNAKDADFKDET